MMNEVDSEQLNSSTDDIGKHSSFIKFIPIDSVDQTLAIYIGLGIHEGSIEIINRNISKIDISKFNKLIFLLQSNHLQPSQISFFTAIHNTLKTVNGDLIIQSSYLVELLENINQNKKEEYFTYKKIDFQTLILTPISEPMNWISRINFKDLWKRAL